MKEDKINKYFTTLAFLFLFEGIQHSILIPIAPFILMESSGFQKDQVLAASSSSNSTEASSHSEVNTMKGHLSVEFGFYMSTYLLFQAISIRVWSQLITQQNFKWIVAMMVGIQALSIFGISMNLPFFAVLILRAIQGFFSSSIGLVKLTIDNKFNPRRDLQRIVDCAGLWFLGLAAGLCIQCILSNPQDKFSPSLSFLNFMEDFKFSYPALLNIILAMIAVIVILSLHPSFSVKKPLYKKMQSTLFLQSLLFSSQNEFTSEVKRHQRTRKTFDRNVFKQVLMQDRNLLFALSHSMITSFIFQGLFDVLPLYMVTVLSQHSELEISIIFGFAYFAVYINSMFFLELNYFEKFTERRITSNDLLMSLTLGVTSLGALYLVRFLQGFDQWILLTALALATIYFSVLLSNQLSTCNEYMEQIALQCGEDSDHVRNLSQASQVFARTLAPITICTLNALNFWQYSEMYLDFTYVFALFGLLVIVSYLLISCFDSSNRDQDDTKNKQRLVVYHSTLGGTENEVYA